MERVASRRNRRPPECCLGMKAARFGAGKGRLRVPQLGLRGSRRFWGCIYRDFEKLDEMGSEGIKHLLIKYFVS